MATSPTWPETPEIHDRGMGPEIRGTRIVMTDIYQWLTIWPVEQIAEFYRLTVPQVQAAIAYIDQHREWVEADIRAIRERAERGNSPEVRAKMEGSHRRLLELRDRLLAEQRQRELKETADARAAG